MNPFAELANPLVDRPCVARSEPAREPPPSRRPKVRASMPKVSNPWGLSPSECRIMPLIVHGMTCKEIAQELCRSVKTIETLTQRLRKKMNARSILVAALAWDRWARSRA